MIWQDLCRYVSWSNCEWIPYDDRCSQLTFYDIYINLVFTLYSANSINNRTRNNGITQQDKNVANFSKLKILIIVEIKKRKKKCNGGTEVYD